MFLKGELALFCVFLSLLSIIETAPRSRSKSSSGQSTTFDQKQTGEYNIQLHLKDFNVIAVVADEAFGDLGEYEYNYDYSDLTIKPSSSTVKPSSTSPSAISSTTQKLSTLKTSTVLSTTTTAPTSHIPTIRPDTHYAPQKPFNGHQIFVPIFDPTYNKTSEPNFVSTTIKPISSSFIPFSTPSKLTTEKVDRTVQTNFPTSSTSQHPSRNAISVEITTKQQDDEIQLTSSTQTESTKKITENQQVQPDKLQESSVNILQTSNDSSSEEETPAVVLGEVMHYRKCSVGYARDKRGRCRRIRKPIPQLSFDFTRLASGLAAKFRRQDSEVPQQ